ncbi:Fic family protein [Phycicoccus avicenniae]|uniref:Fic family protein n=1 Tax=Phycicoccus avicenniae TaxID=2828860 RepID=UPI002010D05B|nr:Fic family protein [Phycicoccus avicenniae]
MPVTPGSESPAVAAVTRLAELPGVPERVEAAREACTRLRWHQALRRRIPEAAAESRVRGAAFSAELEGASLPTDVVRDVMRGAATWSPDPDPVERAVRGVVAATAETEALAAVVLRSPLQALARLHTVSTRGTVPDEALGRPRLPGEDAVELAEVGPAPSAEVVAARLRDVVAVLLATPRLPVVVAAAVVHAELATVRPFVRGNTVVARALERATVQAAGLDPTGVAVLEAGHAAGGTAPYVGALAAYSRGDAAGVGLWVGHCCDAVQAGATEGMRVADAVLAGRLA